MLCVGWEGRDEPQVWQDQKQLPSTSRHHCLYTTVFSHSLDYRRATVRVHQISLSSANLLFHSVLFVSYFSLALKLTTDFFTSVVLITFIIWTSENRVSTIVQYPLQNILYGGNYTSNNKILCVQCTHIVIHYNINFAIRH